jgi:hypothetical protein
MGQTVNLNRRAPSPEMQKLELSLLERFNRKHERQHPWLAGGGVKGGMTYGKTDEFGAKIVKNECHVHDFHATILHCLGFDHTKLTFRNAGRDYRLTDVAGRVVKEILG